MSKDTKACPALTKALDHLLPDTDAEKALGKADADAWFLEVLSESMSRIRPIQSCGNSVFAVARAKRFNVNLKEYEQELSERLSAANKKLATLRNQE
jgi:hypothetical protein